MALHEFCQRKTLERFGRVVLHDLGTTLIMTDNVLDRIVDRTHFGKIIEVEQLAKETRWVWAHAYGPEVLQILSQHIVKTTPILLTTSVTLQPQSHTNQDIAIPIQSAADKVKWWNKCGACKAEGHIGTSWRLHRPAIYS
jgi:hypothetical protein